MQTESQHAFRVDKQRTNVYCFASVNSPAASWTAVAAHTQPGRIWGGRGANWGVALGPPQKKTVKKIIT